MVGAGERILSTVRSKRRLGTFEGVFVPTLLTIAGVILYTRTTWLVGGLGVLKALGVVLCSYAVALFTSLSICSVTSNVRVGAGGAFSLLTKTLGIEAGGSIGAALYLSQTFAAVLYIFGFRSGWLSIFPEHPGWWVDLGVLVVVSILAFISARLAFRAQYVVLLIVVGSMISVLAGIFTVEDLREMPWTLEQQNAGFIESLAVFFPAVTGILAGVNLSGELRTPKRSIRIGLLGAVLVSLCFYILVTMAGAILGPPEQLLEDTATAQLAYSPKLVLFGLLSATFSSALNCIVGAPRILQALAEHRAVPRGHYLSTLASNGEPRRCLGATILLVGTGLLFRDLNAVAPLITLLFLLTYGVLNTTLFLQQSLNLPQFRPSFRVPLIVPFLGATGCFGAMLLISPLFFVASLLLVAAFYWWLENRSPKGPYGQVRAGLVVGILSRALTRLSDVPDRSAWHTHAVLVINQESLGEAYLPMSRALTARGGSLLFLLRCTDPLAKVENMVRTLRADRNLAHCQEILDPDDEDEWLLPTLWAMRGTLIPPNLLVCPLGFLNDQLSDESKVGSIRDMGLGLWFYHFPSEKDKEDESFLWSEIRIWLHTTFESSDGLSLVLLMAWRIHRTHGVPVKWCCNTKVSGLKDELERMRAIARIDDDERLEFDVSLEEALQEAPRHSLNFFLWDKELVLEPITKLSRERDVDLVIAALSGEAKADEE